MYNEPSSGTFWEQSGPSLSKPSAMFVGGNGARHDMMYRHTLYVVGMLILLSGCGPSAEEQAAPIYAEGRRQHEEGDFRGAMDCYDQVIELVPGNAEAYVHRAEARFTLGDPDGARADYDKAIELAPEMAVGYRGRAAILIVLDNTDAALADLDKAIQLDLTDAASYRARRDIHWAKRDLAKAEADWGKATQLEHPEYLVGKVVAVPDGDTITILVDEEEVTIHVHGIDCPEEDQPYGTEAKQLTTDKILTATVSVAKTEMDQYGETFGRVTLSVGGDLSELLIRPGLAWHDVESAPGDEKLAALEAAARKGKRGLWSDPKPPIPPWDWRKGERGENRPADVTGSQPE